MKNGKKILSGFLSLAMVGTMFASIPFSASAATDTDYLSLPEATGVDISYASHVQRIGWQDAVKNGAMSGTEKLALRNEAIAFSLSGAKVPADASITVQVQGQTYAWQAPKTFKANVPLSKENYVGTTGQKKRIEAIKFTLNNMPGYAIAYRAQCQTIGWTDWVVTENGTDIKDATYVGTERQAKRLEAIQVKIIKVKSEDIASISPVNSTIPVGGTTAFVFKDSKGNTVTPSDVSYSVTSSNASKAFFNDGVFTATAAGTYTVCATIDGKQYTTDVVVTSKAVKIAVSLNEDVVANGSPDVKYTVTAKALDENGNVDTTYNGNMLFYTDPTKSHINPPTQTVVAAVNGIATFQITSKDTNTTDEQKIVISSGDLQSGTLTFKQTAQVATAVKLSFASPKEVLAPDGTSTVTVKATVVDQKGVEMKSNCYKFIKFSISGAAGKFKLDETTTSTDEQTKYIDGTSTTIDVVSVKGVTGSVTVTAKIDGLNSDSLTINSILNTDKAAIKATADKTTVGGDGLDYATVTVNVLDTNGIVVADAEDEITLTTSDKRIKTTKDDENAEEVESVKLDNGVAKFRVYADAKGYTGTGTVTLSSANLSKATLTFNFVAGNISSIDVIPSYPVYVTKGSTVTATAQLRDAADNKVAQAGVPVTWTFADKTVEDTTGNKKDTVAGTFSNGLATITTATDANGVAKVTFTAGNAGDTHVLTATIPAGVLGNSAITKDSGTIQVAENAAEVATKLDFADGSDINASSTQLTAGDDGKRIFVQALNAVDESVEGHYYKVESSDKSVVGIGAADTENDTYEDKDGGIELYPRKAGTAKLTITDLSTGLTKEVTVTVVPGEADSYKIVGLDDNSVIAQNSIYGPLTVVLVDKGGNIVRATSKKTIKLSAVDSSGTSDAYGEFRTSPTSVATDTLTINVGQTSSATFYYVTPNSAPQKNPVVITASHDPNDPNDSLKDSTIHVTVQ